MRWTAGAGLTSSTTSCSPRPSSPPTRRCTAAARSSRSSSAADDAALRVVVLDRGATPARAIANRGEGQPSVEALDDESMTGRGLFLVSALASAWGVDDLPGGTRVWAEFVVGA